MRALCPGRVCRREGRQEGGQEASREEPQLHVSVQMQNGVRWVHDVRWTCQTPHPWEGRGKGLPLSPPDLGGASVLPRAKGVPRRGPERGQGEPGQGEQGEGTGVGWRGHQSTPGACVGEALQVHQFGVQRKEGTEEEKASISGTGGFSQGSWRLGGKSPGGAQGSVVPRRTGGDRRGRKGEVAIGDVGTGQVGTVSGPGQG